MKIRPAGAELIHADRRTDRRGDFFYLLVHERLKQRTERSRREMRRKKGEAERIGSNKERRKEKRLE